MRVKRECDESVVVKARGDEDYLAMFMRKITIPLSIFLTRYAKISPLCITYFSTLMMFAIFGLFIASGYSQYSFALRIIGAGLVFAKYILDSLDEKMARMLHSPSLESEWLSKTSVFVYFPMLFISLAIGLKVTDFNLMIVAMLAAISAPLHYLILYSYKKDIEPKMIVKNVALIKEKSRLRYLYSPAYLYILIVVFCAINRPELSFWYFAIFENLFWIGIIILQFRAIKKWEKRI